MFFEQRLIGSMANFGYVFGDPAAKVAAVMDPSFDARVLQKAAAENGYAIGLIFNTHQHVDHVFDNERLANETGGKVAGHPPSSVRKDPGLHHGQTVDGGRAEGKGAHHPGQSPDARWFMLSGPALLG